MDGALQLFWTFADQWKTGSKAEINFFCERGNLKVRWFADLGPWRAPAANLLPKAGESGSPSQLRRRLRRAAERSAAAAAKAGTESVTKKAPAENAVASASAAKDVIAKAAAEEALAKPAAEEVTVQAAAEQVAAKTAAEKAAAKAAAAEVSAKAAALEVSARAAAEKVAAKAAAEEAAAKAVAESAATTAAAANVGATADAAGDDFPLREIFDSDQATTSGKSSQPDLAAAELKFSEFRMRWITRLEKCSDDWALKSKLLESLEDAYLAPVSVLSDGDFSDVKDKFFEGVLSPEKFLEELDKLLSKNC